MFVYLLYHEETDHCYIGSTQNFVKRFLEHNLNGGWDAIMVLETKHYKEVCKRWKEDTMDLEQRVFKGLKLSYNYDSKVYLQYDDFKRYKKNSVYKLPNKVWNKALKIR